MSRLVEIKQKEEELKRKKEEFTKGLTEINKRLNSFEIQNDYVDYYIDYFTKHDSKELELLTKIPEFCIFANNNRYLGKIHPLMDYNIYDIEALSIMLKNLYSIHREGEYGILVYGHTNEIMNYDYADKWNISTPELYFLIGNKRLLKDYEKFNGLYVDEDLTRKIPFESDSQKDMVVLKASNFYPHNKEKEGAPLKITEGVHYTDKHISNKLFSSKTLTDYFASSYSTIIIPEFHNYIYGNTEDYGLTFPIKISDAFIRDFIYSVSLYRKNNDLKRNLTNKELSQIFNTLYSANIDIDKERETAFVKKLKYVDKI